MPSISQDGSVEPSLQTPGPFITVALLLFLGAFFLFLIYMFGLLFESLLMEMVNLVIMLQVLDTIAEEDCEELAGVMDGLGEQGVSRSEVWLGICRQLLGMEIRGCHRELRRTVGIVTLPLEGRRTKISLRPMVRWFRALPRMKVWERLRG